jgi:hypothetical protein
MRFFSILGYIISAVCLYTGIQMGWKGTFNIWYIWDLTSLSFILAGFTLAIINFKFSEITGAVKNALSGSLKSYEIINFDKNVLQVIWRYLLTISVFAIISTMVIMFANLNDTSKLGPSLAIISIIPLYLLTLKFFILMPLEISLEKKIIQLKLQKTPGQVV